MTPNGKDYDISLEDIMSGDTTSSSSGSGGGSGSETGGQGVSEEVLKNLESLTQRMGDLEEKVKTSESSLSELKEAYSGLTSGGGLGSTTLSEITQITGSNSYKISVPDDARGLVLTANDYTSVTIGSTEYWAFVLRMNLGSDGYTRIWPLATNFNTNRL